LSQFFGGLVLESDGSGQPRSFLDSESDSLVKLGHLGFNGLGVSDEDWLSSDSVDHLTDQLGELEFERLRNQKDVVLSGPFLDLLGFLGKSVDFVKVTGIEVKSLGLVNVVKDSDNTDIEGSLDWIMENNGRVEFLLLVNIVVSK
jgi:hypothetical protein